MARNKFDEQFDKQFPEVKLPKEDFDIGEAVGKLGATTALAVSSNRPPHEFVSLADKLSEALLQAANEQLKQAQKNLEDCERMAKEVREAMRQKSEELNDTVTRLNTFADQLLKAHQEFHK